MVPLLSKMLPSMSHVRGHGPPDNIKSALLKYSYAKESRGVQHAWRESSGRDTIARRNAVSRRFSELALTQRFQNRGVSPERRASSRVSRMSCMGSMHPLGIVDPEKSWQEAATPLQVRASGSKGFSAASGLSPANQNWHSTASSANHSKGNNQPLALAETLSTSHMLSASRSSPSLAMSPQALRDAEEERTLRDLELRRESGNVRERLVERARRAAHKRYSPAASPPAEPIDSTGIRQDGPSPVKFVLPGPNSVLDEQRMLLRRPAVRGARPLQPLAHQPMISSQQASYQLPDVKQDTGAAMGEHRRGKGPTYTLTPYAREAVRKGVDLSLTGH